MKYIPPEVGDNKVIYKGKRYWIVEFTGKDKIDGFGLKQLGQMLIDNQIENDDGLPFFIKDGHVKTKLLNPSTGYFKDTQINKPDLRRILIDAHKKGLIKKI